MTIRHEIETFSFFIVAAVAGTTFAFVGGKTPKPPLTINAPIIANLQPSPTDAPLPKPTTVSQVSPDGNKKLSMTQSVNKDGSNTYAFTVVDTATDNPQPIYTVTLTGETMSIPYNTFSPDDKYVFVQYNSKNGTHAWVLRVNGQPINPTTNEQYYDATALFNQRYPNLTYDQITGWASETLLVVLTKNADGTEGQSFWVEIPSKAIIPLATQF